MESKPAKYKDDGYGAPMKPLQEMPAFSQAMENKPKTKVAPNLGRR